MSEDGKRLEEALLGLEKLLMDPVFRKNRDEVDMVLAEEFREFGSSGRIWSREEILHLLATEPAQAPPCVVDFAVQIIAADTALVTYRAIRAESNSATLRSSIWVLRGSRWQVVFHQGTREGQ
jgi:hypothetical protein